MTPSEIAIIRLQIKFAIFLSFSFKSDEKIKRIYNGINFDKFKMVERKDRKEPFKIINVARFYPQKKGQDVLIKATAILKPS